MTKFLRIVLLLAFMNALPFLTKAQKLDSLKLYNAYYLSKEISSPKNLQTPEKERILRLLGGIYWYAGQDTVSWDGSRDSIIFMNYPKLWDKVENLKRQLIHASGIFTVNKNVLANLSKKNDPANLLTGIIGERNRLDSLNEKNKNGVSLIDQYKGLQQSLSPQFEKLENVLQKIYVNDSISKVGVDTILLKNVLTKMQMEDQRIENFIKSAEERIADYKNQKENLISRIDSLYQKLPYQIKLSIADSLLFANGQKSSKEAITGSLSAENVAAVQQYAKAYQSEEAYQVTQPVSLGFKIPTEAEMINALAIYLTTRVKQEAVLWFFEQLRKDARSYDLVATAFPECMRLLQSAEVYEAPNLGTTWRYALAKDFSTLPNNLLRSDWLKNRLPAKYAHIRDYLEIGVNTARYMQEKFSYRDIVRQLYLDMETKGGARNSDSCVRVNDLVTALYAITHELFVIDSAKEETNSRLLTYEELRGMTAAEMEIMMSLMDMKYDSVIRKMTGRLGLNLKYDRNSADKIARWAGKITLTISQFDKVNNEFRQIKEQSKDPDYQFSYYNVWKLLSEVLHTLIPETGLKENIKNNTLFALDRLDDVNEVYELILNKNYAGSVAKVLNMVDSLVYGKEVTIRIAQILTKESETKVDTSNYGAVNISNFKKYINHYAAGVNIKTKEISELTVNRNSLAAAYFLAGDRKAMEALRKIASFLSDVAMAKGEKQLAKVVNSYAMPPGSYKRKRNTWSSWDLNAFVGPYAGYEFIPRKTQYTKNDVGNVASLTDKGLVYGISAPIGITYSHTWGKKLCKNTPLEKEVNSADALKFKRNRAWKRSGVTTSFTISLIDIGAVVSYRLDKNINSDTTFAPHDFKWAQILSPGLHANIGIPGTPLVFSLGAQFTPQLRKVEDNGLELAPRQFNAFRVYGGVFFDIPMFNLWTKKYR